MTVDDRLRDAHARIPDPDLAAVARARARLTAALEDAPVVRRRRRHLATVLPVAALAAAAVAVVAVVRGDDAPLEREAVQTPVAQAGGPVAYQRNMFQVSIRYIGADGRPTARSRDAAFGIARFAPEEIWRAPDGSGRIVYDETSAAYLPSPADERAWRAAGSPDLEKLAGAPGSWGPKQQNYGPGKLDAALLFNSNLEKVLPARDPLSVVPVDQRELAAWLDAAAVRQRPGGSDRLVRDTVVGDALTFLRDPRASKPLRVALIGVLASLDGARRIPPKIFDAASRLWPMIELEGGLVIAYDPDACKLMAEGARYGDGVRWNRTYAVLSRRVAAIGQRP